MIKIFFISLFDGIHKVRAENLITEKIREFKNSEKFSQKKCKQCKYLYNFSKDFIKIFYEK